MSSTVLARGTLRFLLASASSHNNKGWFLEGQDPELLQLRDTDVMEEQSWSRSLGNPCHHTDISASCSSTDRAFAFNREKKDTSSGPEDVGKPEVQEFECIDQMTLPEASGSPFFPTRSCHWAAASLGLRAAVFRTES